MPFRIHVRTLVQAGGLVGREIARVRDVDLARASVGQHLLQMYDEPGFRVLPFGPRDVDVEQWAFLPLSQIQREDDLVAIFLFFFLFSFSPPAIHAISRGGEGGISTNNVR